MAEWEDDDREDGAYGPIDSGATDEDRTEALAAMDDLLGSGADAGADDTPSSPAPAGTAPTLTVQGEALAGLPAEHREQILALAARHGWREDDPIWAVISVGGLYCRAAASAVSAARSEIERTREEASGAIAGALAAGQQAIAEASAREVAAMETSARQAVASVIDDLRQRAGAAIEEVQRASPAHRTLWQRLWPALLSLTTAIGVGVGVGAGAHLLAAPPYLAPLIIDDHGDIYAVPQGQTLAKDKNGQLFAHVAPVKIQPLRRQE